MAPVRHLFDRVVRPLARREHAGAFDPDFRRMGIDDTTLAVDNAPAHAAAFGRPAAGPRSDGAFPQVKKLSLVELGTQVEVARAVKPDRNDERALVAGLLGPRAPRCSCWGTGPSSATAADGIWKPAG